MCIAASNCVIQECSVQFLQGESGPVLFAAMTVTTPSWLTASEPDVLEEKRLAERCSATHGGTRPDALACLESGAVRFAVHGY